MIEPTHEPTHEPLHTPMHEDSGRREGAKKSLSDLQISRLLQMSLSGSDRPIDKLVVRLSESDGVEWFESQLVADPIAPFLEGLRNGTLSRDELDMLRRAGKRQFSAGEGEATMTGVLAYLLALAATLARHGVWASERRFDEVVHVLEDLVALLPSPWKEIVETAAKGPPPRRP
jgi:hypothetical protein